MNTTDILEEFGLVISANKPAIIKMVRPFINYEEQDMEGDKKCLIVSVEVYMETEDCYTSIPWLSEADSFESEEEKEKLKEGITKNLLKTLKEDLSADYTKNYWEDRDLEQEIWKNKEE